MSKSHLLGVDLGAGSLKASVIRSDGSLAGEAAHPVTTQIPHYGWSEQDPEEWVAAFASAAPAALKQAGVEAAEIAAIGLSGGAHIPVLLDADDRPVRPAILWNDQRAVKEARALHEAHGEEIIATSLNRVNPTWSLAMLAWLKAHEPETMARVRKLMIAKDYLRFRLTGTWETDFSDVLGALMADHRTRSWSPALCKLIDWPLETLPPVVEPSDVVGGVTAKAAKETGLAEGTPVVCGSNDTTVEFYGVGAVEPGMGAIKLATAGVLFLAADRPVVNPPISCYPHILDGMWYTATGTNSCASAHRWVRDRFFAEEGFAGMDRLAASAPAGSQGLLFHPYLQGERAPWWDPQLRANFLGLTMRHGRAEFARATYEGIAFSIRDLVEQAKGFGQSFGTVKLLGGGAKSDTWRQILADVTGLTIERPGNGDASFGAALVAGVGVGLFASARDAVAQCVTTLDRNEPGEDQALYDAVYPLYREATVRLQELDHRLHEIFVK